MVFAADDTEWVEADVVEPPLDPTQADAEPLPGAVRDQPQLVLYVFLACLAIHYIKWAASHKNTAEVRRPAP